MFAFVKPLARDFWAEYAPLVTAVVEAVVEFVVLVGILKFSRSFVQWASPNLTCGDVIDCVHAGGLLVVWLMLVMSFVLYGIVYGYLKFKSRVRHLRGHFQGGEDRLAAVELKVIQNDAIVLAISASGPHGTFTDRDRAIELLNVAKGALGVHALVDRKINLLLARLQRLQGRPDRAVITLGVFIGEKERLKLFDEDLADAYYNRACYHLQISAGAEQQEMKNGAKERAYADLTRSIELNPMNRVDARQDGDFDAVRQEPQFVALVGP